jgi:PhnB protein
MKDAFIQPYLLFGGRCEEALEFYRRAVGAEIDLMLRYDQSPQPMPAEKLPPGFEKKVMHSTFRIGTSTLMASDGAGESGVFAGFALTIGVSSKEDADRFFTALAQGGTVTMPLTETFWSPRFGMLKDRFGVAWMISVKR